ncbi:MAG: hypothetical protein AAGI01_16170 [Myxococcota bacterium]
MCAQHAKAQPIGAPSASSDAASALPNDPGARLERAEDALRRIEYQKLRPTLENMLIPEPKFDTKEDRIRARLLYMIGLFFELQTGSLDVTLPSTIREQALALLREDPHYKPNSNIVPRGLITIIDDVRAQNQEELDRLKQVDEPEGQQLLTREFARNPYYINFLPGGLPQFQNGQDVKGTLVAVGQTAALGANIAFWTQHRLIVTRENDSSISRQNAQTQSRLLAIERNMYIALGVFAAIYLYSAIDGMRNYEPMTLFREEVEEVGGGSTRAPLDATSSPLKHIPIAPVFFEWTLRF